MLNRIGIAITFLQSAILVTAFFRRRRRPLAVYGWLALAGLVAAEGLLFAGVPPVAIYFTPIAWTCYILLVDASVLSIRGHSLLHDQPRQFAGMAVLSVPLWLIFEGYNLRLQNWIYYGVPQHWALAFVGYAWSFATITPGIFETADLIESLDRSGRGKGVRLSRRTRAFAVFIGALCLLLPILVAPGPARRLFILVWIGFIFLLDPVNHRLSLPSLLGDLEHGHWSRFSSLLISGFVCGWFWEFWNYWAAAKWYYVFPMFQQFKIFEMPVPGYLGFLPFALECFVMYVTASAIVL
ncbi:MAG: hypothetical protein J2P13_11710, partial [Acidobacteria bacterium]|nr:hypothetical protein [Acidobacteriota bacterium]